MYNHRPPNHTTHFVDLPLSRLHIMEAGEGEPLIIVPATISELENWRELTKFMAQWFHVHFFELPGHGESSPFDGKFSRSEEHISCGCMIGGKASMCGARSSGPGSWRPDRF